MNERLKVLSFREAVDELGGTGRLAEMLDGRHPSAISQALSRRANGILAPSSWFDVMETALKRHGCTIPRTEFAFVRSGADQAASGESETSGS